MFKPQGQLPVTGETILNEVTPTRDNFFLSYNPSARDYGCPTTAIVIGNHALFFILKGNHKDALAAASEAGGLSGVMDYFIAHIDEAHGYSDHTMIWKEDHPLHYKEHAETYLGAAITARLGDALARARGNCEE